MGDNNVINAVGVPGTGSTVFDPNTVPVTGGAQTSTTSSWVGSSAATTAVLSVAIAIGPPLVIAWTYIGSEAANQNNFTVSSTAGAPIASNTVPGGNGFPADNRDNNCCFGINPLPVLPMGHTTYSNQSGTFIPNFTLTDLTTSASVTNNGLPGSNPPPNGGAANLIFSYLTPGRNGFQWDLTNTQTNVVLTGFNDNGSVDDNHDDFMFIGQILIGSVLNASPLPAALPLFVTGLGAMGLLGWRRKKKSAANVA